MSFAGITDLDPSDQKELQRIQEAEGQKAMLQGVINKLTNTCFKKCMYPGVVSNAAISSSEESCLRDCVNRFMEVQGIVLKKAGAQ